MLYRVIASDGSEYGPVDRATLAQWARENRLLPTSLLRDDQTSKTFPATEFRELFPNQVASRPSVEELPFSNPRTAPIEADDDKRSINLMPFIVSTLAVAAMAFLHLGIVGIGLGVVGLAAAVYSQMKRDRYGVVALLFSGITLAIVYVGHGAPMP